MVNVFFDNDIEEKIFMSIYEQGMKNADGIKKDVIEYLTKAGCTDEVIKLTDDFVIQLNISEQYKAYALSREELLQRMQWQQAAILELQKAVKVLKNKNAVKQEEEVVVDTEAEKQVEEPIEKKEGKKDEKQTDKEKK